MKHRLLVRCSLGLVLLLAASVGAAEDLRIELLEHASVRSTLVFLRDVAKLSCDDPSALAAAEAVQLQELDLSIESTMITERSVRTHMVLAGWRLEDFGISGSQSVEVTYEEPQPLTDEDIEEQAQRVMMEIMGVGEKDVVVRLQSPFVQSLPKELRSLDGLRVEILPPRRGLGMVTMQVQVRHGEDVKITRPATFDVRKRHRVAVAKVSLSRDLPMDDRSVQFENRFLSAEVDELDASQVLGQQVRFNVVAGSILQMRDIQTSRSGAAIVVKKGDAVKVLAVAGKLETVLRNAEALQSGGIGETIKLKNRDSGQEIVAKILGPGTARIQVR